MKKKRGQSAQRVHCSLNGKRTLCGQKATGMFYTQADSFVKAAKLYSCCRECQEIARQKLEVPCSHD